MMQPNTPILLEYIRHGHGMEVRAIDPEDGLEVTLIAPTNTPDAEIELLARRKLQWVRAKKSGEEGGNGKRPPRSPGGGRGILA